MTSLLRPLTAGLRALSCLLALLAAACTSSTDHHFINCDPGWKNVSGTCRQICETLCPEGQQCAEGVCIECVNGVCPSCGDGKLDDGEQCDDGNLDPGDGCSACAVEDNWKCSKASPSTCQCASGYQDNDKDGVCTPNCATAALDCAARGVCTDANGTAHCECDPGYQDNDNADGCKPDCETAMLHCGDNAACSDKNGTATCLCDPGYQDKDEDGACLAECTPSSCGKNASCDDSSGTATCSCNKAFQDNDGDGDCGEDCSETDCGPNGTCDDSSGTAICNCASGYQDNDGAGDCEPDCKTAALKCQQNQHCDDSSGTATCLCDADYQDNDGKNGCEPTCAKAALACGVHASCDDGSGTAACTCDAHYRDPGNDGACEVATCYTNPSTCGATKYCALDTEDCTLLPKVPNGDFSCKSGGVCDVAWDLTSDVTVGNDCGSSLFLSRAAYQQVSPGVNGDHHANVSVAIPAYASIDPPGAAAGPLALTIDSGLVCKNGPSGPTCGSQPSFPGNDLMVSVDGRQRQRFSGGGVPNCSGQKRTICLDQDSYGRDVVISIAPGSYAPPFDEPMAKVLVSINKVALVRDASCPIPGVVPFQPGDWGGAVGGTAGSPFLDFTLNEYCQSNTEAQALLSVPSSSTHPAFELEVTATPNGDGVYPDLKLGWLGADGGGDLGTYTSAPTKSVRVCLPAKLAGQVNRYTIGASGTQPCTPTVATLQVRKVTIVEASATDCP